MAGPGPNVNGRGQGAGPGPNVNGRGPLAGPWPGGVESRRGRRGGAPAEWGRVEWIGKENEVDWIGVEERRGDW